LDETSLSLDMYILYIIDISIMYIYIISLARPEAEVLQRRRVP
jgi:hypothetical protein